MQLIIDGTNHDLAYDRWSFGITNNLVFKAQFSNVTVRITSRYEIFNDDTFKSVAAELIIGTQSWRCVGPEDTAQQTFEQVRAQAETELGHPLTFHLAPPTEAVYDTLPW